MIANSPAPAAAPSLRDRAVADFRAQLRGSLIERGQPDYEAARQVYNGMIEKYPAFIVRAANAADVSRAVNWAREQRLAVAIRGGGHSGPGLGTVADGLVIDLSQMRAIHVDPARSTVRVEGGATWAEVDAATHPFGLAVPSGFLSSTGVGGLTLGGGIGYLARKYGLTIDSLLGVEMVLADGRQVTANATEHADLYWAVRGGGGNFGVVTAFVFQGRPVHTVYGGPMFWPLEQAPAVMKYWKELIASAPDDLNGWFAFVTVPPAAPFPEPLQLHKMCAIVWCYTGPLDQGEAALQPIRAAFPPAIDFAGPIEFPALQSMFDALYPAGLRWYWKADFFNQLDDKAIALHAKYGAQLPSLHSTMHIYPINGAAGRVARTDTPWSFRDATLSEVIVGVDPDPANDGRITEWAKNYWLALHPYSAGGAYLNMIMEEGDERVQSAYRENYTRLAQVKAMYDPTNFFHVNQNIKPKA